MLIQLNIYNYAIASSIELSFKHGFISLTGETGAGKSISLNALNLVLGARADIDSIGPHQKNAEVSATFDITHAPKSQLWLADNNLDINDNECLLRRVINKEGRSRAYINGRPAVLQQVQSLAKTLVSIHEQHAQQLLLERSHQLWLLDQFGQLNSLSKKVKHLAQQWTELSHEIQDLENHSEQHHNQIDLLQYQINELSTLALQEGDFTELELQQKRLNSAEVLLSLTHDALNQCQKNHDTNILQTLNSVTHNLEEYIHEPLLKESLQLLKQATIDVEEACINLNEFSQNITVNPQHLTETETRLQQVFEIARKHRISPTELHLHEDTLNQQLQILLDNTTRVAKLKIKRDDLHKNYINTSEELGQARRETSEQLIQLINEKLKVFNMPNALFSIEFEATNSKTLSPSGLETPIFMIRTNSSQPPRPLKKVASGGELSRISLAIELATQNITHIPTLIFDEVDTGIGGATAEVIGQQMRLLGESRQIICITHQAQLAAKAHYQFNVHKVETETSTTVDISELDHSSRVEEIARMISGVSLTPATLEHAKELLK
jgi:DNA repair protein RecN (Recombination protein N)